MLYLILVSSGFFVQQINGSAIPGAWVGSDGAWFGVTNHIGYYGFHGSEPDSISVHATGFRDWSGLIPSEGTIIYLHEAVFNTGEYILVTASRGSLESAIPSTTRLTDHELSELSTAGMSSLNGKIPGISVREYGGSMPVVSISVRGGDPGQVDHMIDGISIVSSRDGMLTGLFDPAVFSSVEIARGGAIPGGSGTGSSGAVNYLPPLSSQPLSLRFTGLSDGGAYITGKYRETGFSLRRNKGSNGTSGYSTTLLTTRNYNNLRTGLLGAWASGEVEGPDWALPSDGSREQGQIEGWATYAANDFEVDVSTGAGLMSFYQNQPYTVDDTHKDLSLRTSFLWNGPVSIRGGFNSTWLNSTASDNHSLQFGTVHLGLKAGVFNGSIGCRIESADNIHLSGRAAAVKHFAGNIFSAQVSAYSDHRSPTVNDLYWPSDAFSSGNPDLKSERTSGVETGVDWNNGLFSGRICGFATTTTNMILWLPDDSGIWSPSNVSSSLSRGLENSALLEAHNFLLSGTFTWNLSTDETANTIREGMMIPYRPEYTWGAAADIEIPWKMAFKIDFNGVAKRFTNRTQSTYLDQYWLAGVSLEREISSRTNIELAVTNILNTDYQETNGYRGRGRTLRLGLEYTGD